MAYSAYSQTSFLFNIFPKYNARPSKQHAPCTSRPRQEHSLLISNRQFARREQRSQSSRISLDRTSICILNIAFQLIRRDDSYRSSSPKISFKRTTKSTLEGPLVNVSCQEPLLLSKVAAQLQSKSTVLTA